MGCKIENCRLRGVLSLEKVSPHHLELRLVSSDGLSLRSH